MMFKEKISAEPPLTRLRLRESGAVFSALLDDDVVVPPDGLVGML